MSVAVRLIGRDGVETPDPEHVGLWLERCYHGDRDAEKPNRRRLHERAVSALRVGSPAVSAWRVGFERWQRDLVSKIPLRRALVVETVTRLMLHPNSNGSVTDGAVLLHHTWGVPYLPGSALKGVTRHHLERSGVDEKTLRALFGEVPESSKGGDARAGMIEFHDAMWIPEAPLGSSTWSPLALDVVNPHASGYYTGRSAPTDREEPVPTHRLTVSRGTRFLVAIEGIGDADVMRPWLDEVVDRGLAPAFAETGIGAWGRAGYGRMRVVDDGRPAAPRRSAREWFEVTVYLDPGSGRLSCVLPDGRRAEVTGARARELRSALGHDAQGRFEKKRAAKIGVAVEQNGNAWMICALREG